MGFTYTEEIPCKVSAKRILKALIVEPHIHLPKIVPDGMKSIEYVHGEGCVVGGIKETKFAEGGHFKGLKRRMDAIDEEKFYCKFTLVEGDIIFDRIESIVYKMKLKSIGDCCVCKMNNEYHTKARVELNEKEVKKGKDKALGLFKAVEEYLIVHLEVCA